MQYPTGDLATLRIAGWAGVGYTLSVICARIQTIRAFSSIFVAGIAKRSAMPAMFFVGKIDRRKACVLYWA